MFDRRLELQRQETDRLVPLGLRPGVDLLRRFLCVDLRDGEKKCLIGSLEVLNVRVAVFRLVPQNAAAVVSESIRASIVMEVRPIRAVKIKDTAAVERRRIRGDRAVGKIERAAIRDAAAGVPGFVSRDQTGVVNAQAAFDVYDSAADGRRRILGKRALIDV